MPWNVSNKQILSKIIQGVHTFRYLLWKYIKARRLNRLILLTKQERSNDNVGVGDGLDGLEHSSSQLSSQFSDLVKTWFW